MEQKWARIALYPYDVLQAPTPGVLTLRAFCRSSDLRTFVDAADVIEVQWSQFLPLAREIRDWRRDVPVSAFLHDLYGDSLAQLASRAESIRIRTVARLTHRRAAARELSLVLRRRSRLLVQ